MDFYYFNILLKETYKNLGQYEIITNPDIIGDLQSITFSQTNSSIVQQTTTLPPILVTGLTTSRLNEVKTYNINIPYKIGVNGVTNITTDFIEYTIDDIKYQTFLSDGLTTYQILKQQDVFQNQPVIWNADSVFVDIKKTLNAMVIERGNISVFEYFGRLNNCDSLSDMEQIF